MSRLRNIVIAVLLLTGVVAAPAQALDTPTVGTWAAISATYGVGTVAITPPTSNSAGAWTYTSEDTAVAEVAGSTLVIKAVGTSRILASQAATDTYSAGVALTTLTVAPAAPTVADFAAMTKSLDTPTFTIVAPTSTSAGAWTYTSSDATVASIDGAVVTLHKVGAVTITATQAANWNWAATTKTATLTVTGAAPTIGAWQDLSLTYGAFASLTLTTPVSNSAGTWTYASSDTAVATVSGQVLTPVAVGTTTITATQAASGNFAAATKTMTVRIVGGPPTIGAFADRSAQLELFGANNFTIVPPTSNSTGAWTFTSSDASVATISGTTIHMKALGSITVTATQAAAGNYSESTPVKMTFSVLGASPVVGILADVTKNYGDADFTVTAPTSSSAGAWTFSSGNPAVATVTGNTVHIVGAGTVTISAKQAANWNWGEAIVTMTLLVRPIAPTVGTLPSYAKAFGDGPITVTAPTSNSTGAWTYASSNTAVATVSGNVITIVGNGVATIAAVQLAAGNYAQSSPVSFTITVRLPATVGAFGDVSAVFGTTAPALTAPTSNSTGAWTYASSNPAVVAVSGSTLTYAGVGTAVITATQAATDVYAATTRTFNVSVAAATPMLQASSIMNMVFTATPLTLPVVTSPSNGAITFTSSNPAVAAIVNGKLVLKSAGAANITATQAATANYLAANVVIALTVTPLVKVSISGRTLTVVLQGAAGKVTIDGKTGIIGKNTLTPGKHVVKVGINSVIVFNKTYTVK